MRLLWSLGLSLVCGLTGTAALHGDDVGVVVAFGDSTTAPRGPLKVYADVLQEMYDADGTTAEVINAGVGGNHTGLARRRFESDVLQRNPDSVIIQFGINDAAMDVWKTPPATDPRVSNSEYTSNLREFIRALKERGAHVVLMTPNPLCWTDGLKQRYGSAPYEPDDPDGFNVLLQEYAKSVRKLADDEAVTLVDVFELFSREDLNGGVPVSELLLDGMHPNTAGHKLIAQRLAEVIPVRRSSESLVASITKQTLWENRDGKGKTWFHPRACMMPGADGEPVALMTLQEIAGSDYFGQVHWSVSSDVGRTWSEPQPIPALGREPLPGRDDQLAAAVCDVTPQYHPQTNTVLALGHVVFYKGDYFARDEQLPRYPVYVTRDADGTWSRRKILEWDDPRGAFIYSNNCGQRVNLPNGDVQMSFTFGPQEKARMVSGVLASFDGDTLSVSDVGPPMTNAQGRGLLEPSVTRFDDQFWITMRAEDNHGYVSVSDDGLHFEPMRPWTWDDGSPLTMSTTQQHWLTHSDGLFLVYTRRDASNENVIRWRSPLWMARVDVQRRCLIRATEQIVLPLVGDGINDPNQVALMGNFNVTNVSEEESWVTVGEWMPRSGYRGNVLLARIRWARPNRLPLW